MNTSLLETMARHGIGLNTRFFEQLQTTNSKYPPHNITQVGDDYRLTMAVSGFTADDIEISVQDEHLTVTGKQSLQSISDSNHEKVLYRGISSRDFTSVFMIGDVEVKTANLKNGLLEIDLIRHIPEAKKVKKIAIASS